MKVKKQTMIETLNAAYDFYAHNPGASSADLAVAFHLPKSTGRSRSRALVARGCLTTGTVTNHRHQSVEVYFIEKGKRPDGMSVDPAFYGQRFVPCEFKRNFVPARQLGMPAYADLPLSFFGSVRQVAA